MSVNQSKTRITTPETCKMFILYQLLFKMVVKSNITKLKWEKAKNCYSALIYSVFTTAFSNRQVFLHHSNICKKYISCVHLKKSLFNLRQISHNSLILLMTDVNLNLLSNYTKNTACKLELHMFKQFYKCLKKIPNYDMYLFF